MAKQIRNGLRKLIAILDADTDDSCLEFKYRSNADGYSQPRLSNGKTVYAHRFSYCWANGVSYEEIKDLCVMHSCDNPCCVNPKHLSNGTWDDNNKDRASKSRTVVSSSRRKLSQDDVAAIKSRYDPSKKRDKINGVNALARDFNVDTNVIYKALKGGYDWAEETKTC